MEYLFWSHKKLYFYYKIHNIFIENSMTSLTDLMTASINRGMLALMFLSVQKSKAVPWYSLLFCSETTWLYVGDANDIASIDFSLLQRIFAWKKHKIISLFLVIDKFSLLQLIFNKVYFLYNNFFGTKIKFLQVKFILLNLWW